jgi:2-phosphosulfolactate phosphatase
MEIGLIATAQLTNPALCEGKTVVVIDVLRATSVIVTALANGANKIYTTEGIPEARNLLTTFLPNAALLGGERAGKKIEGFDLGNSPLSYTAEVVRDKNIILTTTNGTLAIRNSKTAKQLFAVSFLNVLYAAKVLAETNQPLMIVCSGTNGNFSLDDALCAGMLIDSISRFVPVQCDDLGQVALAFYRQEGSIQEKLSDCRHVKFLRSIGYEKDVEYCLQPNLFEALPEYFPEGYLALKQ